METNRANNDIDLDSVSNKGWQCGCGEVLSVMTTVYEVLKARYYSTLLSFSVPVAVCQFHSAGVAVLFVCLFLCFLMVAADILAIVATSSLLLELLCP